MDIKRLVESQYKEWTDGNFQYGRKLNEPSNH